MNSKKLHEATLRHVEQCYCGMRAYAGGIMSWAAKSVTLGADVNSVQLAAGVHCEDVGRKGGRVETRVEAEGGKTQAQFQDFVYRGTALPLMVYTI